MMNTYRVTRETDGAVKNVLVPQSGTNAGMFSAAIKAHEEWTGSPHRTVFSQSDGTIAIDDIVYLRPELVPVN